MWTHSKGCPPVCSALQTGASELFAPYTADSCVLTHASRSSIMKAVTRDCLRRQQGGTMVEDEDGKQVGTESHSVDPGATMVTDVSVQWAERSAIRKVAWRLIPF